MLTLDTDVQQVERFLLTFTLAFRSTDCLRVFRQRVQQWCVDPAVLLVRRGSPPAEVQVWRRSTEPLLFPGAPQNAAEIRRRLCWDLLINGDARKRGVIEHWCVGASCCPGGRADLVRKLLGPCGIVGLLQPPPAVFPRKSWAGQAEVVTHCLLLELCGGAISRNFHTLVKQAETRAEKAAVRFSTATAPELLSSIREVTTRVRSLLRPNTLSERQPMQSTSIKIAQMLGDSCRGRRASDDFSLLVESWSHCAS